MPVAVALPVKRSTYVDVSGDLFHRPGQRDPKHSGWLRMRLDDAQLIAEPCPVCFPTERTAA